MTDDADQVRSALERIVRDKGLRRQACDLLKRDEDTLLRNRERLDQWRFSEVLLLMGIDERLDQAVKSLFRPQLPSSGTPRQAFQDALIELDRMGQLTSAISATLADGNIDPREARTLLTPLREVTDFATTRLIPELEAISRLAR